MIVEFLNEELRQRRQRNPRYSLRMFARLVNVDASALSKILKGERPLSLPVARRILKALKVDESLKSTLLLAMHEGSQHFPTDESYLSASPISAEQMQHWEFYAVLSLLELPEIKTDAAYMAKRLNSNTERIANI